jgi:hypothetical protein
MRSPSYFIFIWIAGEQTVISPSEQYEHTYALRAITPFQENKNTLPIITLARCKQTMSLLTHQRLLELALVVGGLADNKY